jgi:hypothetical protein
MWRIATIIPLKFLEALTDKRDKIRSKLFKFKLI